MAKRRGKEAWQRGVAKRRGKEAWQRGVAKRRGKEVWPLFAGALSVLLDQFYILPEYSHWVCYWTCFMILFTFWPCICDTEH